MLLKNSITFSASSIIHVCDGSQSGISCPVGWISIVSVNWGRTDPTTCCSNSGQCTNTNCYSDLTNTFKGVCELKPSCTITTSDIGDPCGGILKYVSVTWQCISEF
jgi:hypothetical protein